MKLGAYFHKPNLPINDNLCKQVFPRNLQLQQPLCSRFQPWHPIRNAITERELGTCLIPVWVSGGKQNMFVWSHCEETCLALLQFIIADSGDV